MTAAMTAAAASAPEDILARAYFRRLQMGEHFYENAPVMGGDEAHDEDTHHVTVRFMAGHHCPEQMTYFGTMDKTATAVLSTLANAMKHLEEGAKKPLKKKPTGAPLRLSDANLYYSVTTVLEAIPSEPDPKKDNQRVCAGYAFHWIFHEKNPRAATAAANDDPPQDADSADGSVAAAAPAVDPAASVGSSKKAKETRAKMLVRITEVARKNPLAYAISRSCAEATELNEEIRMRRERFKKTLKIGEGPATIMAHDRIPDPSKTEYYQFAAFEEMDSFLFGDRGIQLFYQPKAGCHRSIPSDDPGNAFLKIVSGSNALADIDDILSRELRGTGLPPSDYYVSPLSPLNPDRIFSLERSLVYLMRDGSYRVSRKSCDLCSYIPGARINPTAERNHNPHVHHGSPIIRNLANDNDNDDDDDDEHDNEDDDGITSLRNLLVDGTGEPYYSMRSARPHYPWPRLTWKLNRQASYAEMLGWSVQAPIPIGAVIPDSAFEPLPPSGESYRPSLVSDSERVHMLESIVNLNKMGTGTSLSTTLAAATAPPPPTEQQRQIPPGTPSRQTPRHGRILGIESVENVSDTSDTMANLMARGQGNAPSPDSPVYTAEEREAAKRQQIAVVKNTLAAVVKRFKGRYYDELTATWMDRHEEPTSNTFMPRAEFFPPRDIHDNSNLSQLELARRHLEQIKVTKNLSQEEENLVRYYVDIIPLWQLQRNEFLEKRSLVQMAHAVMTVQQEAELKTIRLDTTKSEETKEALLAEADMRHLLEKDKWYAQNYKLYDDTFHTTPRASPALLAVRDYIKLNVYPHRNKTRFKPTSFNARPYTVTGQFYLDTYRSVELVTKQNSMYMHRAHVCAHHAFRWMPRREEPALNYTLVGASGIGKSFCLKIAQTLTPDGVVSDTTSQTTASNNVDNDFDGDIVIYQEMDSQLLFPNANKNDTGATDKINFAKARMTSFFTRVKYFHQDEETGKRTAAYCVSSQHIVTMGATNQKLDDMDKNMKRRLLIDYVSEQAAGSDGGQVHELVRISSEATPLSISVPEHTRIDHRELYCAYVYVETAIKMGVQPELLEMGAMILLNCILREAHVDKGISINSKGHRTWILEVARILSIQNACYRGLFSPEAFAVYASTKNTIERWSPQAFHLYVGPQLWISKDALIHALTMFDFLYCSRDDDRLLATIALRVCHLADSAHWRFRSNCGSDSFMETKDYNYLSFQAPSFKKLGEQMADAHKHIGKYRPEDIRPQMSALEGMRRPSLGFEAKKDDSGKVVALIHKTDGIEEDRPAIIYEMDTTSNAKSSPWQFCISIEFLESRFKINIEHDTPAQIIKAIECPERLLDASLFDQNNGDATQLWATMHEMVKCVETRAPLVGSVLKVLNSPNLERSPFEDESLGLTVPEEVYRYMTFYLPDDARLCFDDGTSKKSIRVPLDGTPMLLHANRNSESAMMLMQDNFTKPLLTAQHSLFQQQDTHTGEEEGGLAAIPEMSKGVVLDKYDVDYHMAFEQMRRLGHPGIPELHEIFIKACIADRDMDAFPDASEYEARLFERIPELHPKSGYPLPFAFPPIAFRTERYLARHVHHSITITNYPASNIEGRLRDTIERTESRANGNASGAYEKISERNQYDLHHQRAMRNVQMATQQQQQPLGPPPPLRKRARVASDEEEEHHYHKRPRTSDIASPSAPFSHSLRERNRAILEGGEGEGEEEDQEERIIIETDSILDDDSDDDDDNDGVDSEDPDAMNID